MNTRQQLAAKNREELLTAAIHVFQIHGINAPLQLIMDQAKVGRATFYRNFSDRKSLVIALMTQALDNLEHRAQKYMNHEDGFICLIQDHINHLPYLTALMEFWRVIDRDDPILINVFQRRDEILQPLISKSIKNGVCRPDFRPQDYAMVTAILRASLQGHTTKDQKKIATRAVELLLNGIRV
jgi:AcrR family transcriptional regulator